MCKEERRWIRFSVDGNEHMAVAWDSIAIVVHLNSIKKKDGTIELGTESYNLSLKSQPVTMTVRVAWLDEESKQFLRRTVFGETELQQ